MVSHGYGDDFDIVDADGSWNQYDSYAMRRAPQQPAIHMTQQMTTKVPLPMMEGPDSLLLRVQLMIGVTLQSWNLRNADLH